LQTGIAPQPLADNLETLWKFTAKDGIESAPAIVGDSVYVASMDEHIYALSAGQRRREVRLQARESAPFKAAPAVRDGAVFVGERTAIFHCLDAATGKLALEVRDGREIVFRRQFHPGLGPVRLLRE